MTTNGRWIGRYLWVFVAAVLAVAGGVLLGGLLAPPEAETSGVALVAIWWLSVGMAVAGAAYVWRDSYRVFREAGDADALGAHVLSGGTGSPFKARKDPTCAQRRAGEFERAGGRAESARGWLESAHNRTALELSPLGAAARAISGFLLLFAVLGTFAGMSKAVPGLASALTRALGEAGSVDVSALQAPLNIVADAFGANLVALFASVILGIASFGLTQARGEIYAMLVTSLDELSWRTGGSGGGDLAEAVNKMATATGAVGRVGADLKTLGGSLDRLQHTLPDAISSKLTSQVEVRLHGEVAKALNTSSEKLGEVARAVAANSTAYQGLLADWDKRVESLHVLEEGLRGASQDAVGALGKFGARAHAGLEGLSEVIGKSVENVESGVSGIVDGASRVGEDIAESLGTAGDRLEKAESNLAATLSQIGESQGALGALVEEQIANSKEVSEAAKLFSEGVRTSADHMAHLGESTTEATQAVVDGLVQHTAASRQEAADLTAAVRRDLLGATRGMKESSERVVTVLRESRAEDREDASRLLVSVGENLAEVAREIREGGEEVIRSAAGQTSSQAAEAAMRIEVAQTALAKALEDYRTVVLGSFRDPGVTANLSASAEASFTDLTKAVSTATDPKRADAMLAALESTVSKSAQTQAELSSAVTELVTLLRHSKDTGRDVVTLSGDSVAELARALRPRRGLLGFFRRS